MMVKVEYMFEVEYDLEHILEHYVNEPQRGDEGFVDYQLSDVESLTIPCTNYMVLRMKNGEVEFVGTSEEYDDALMQLPKIVVNDRQGPLVISEENNDG